jgi:electron transport complex protein RnfG
LRGSQRRSVSGRCATVRDMIRYGIILTLICAVSGASLSVVYSKTSVIIEARKAETALKAMSVVLPAATKFEIVAAEKVTEVAAGQTGILEAYLGSSETGAEGAIVKVASNGYGGAITMLVGIDTNGTCQGMQIISQSETAGLGSRITEAAFMKQFAGQSGLLAIKKMGGKVDGVSGATISSKAAVAGVNKALDFAKALLGI